VNLVGAVMRSKLKIGGEKKERKIGTFTKKNNGRYMIFSLNVYISIFLTQYHFQSIYSFEKFIGRYKTFFFYLIFVYKKNFNPS